jgi:hypothetical protein
MCTTYMYVYHPPPVRRSLHTLCTFVPQDDGRWRPGFTIDRFIWTFMNCLPSALVHMTWIIPRKLLLPTHGPCSTLINGIVSILFPILQVTFVTRNATSKVAVDDATKQLEFLVSETTPLSRSTLRPV